MSKTKARDPEDLALSKKVTKNVNHLIQNASFTQMEIAEFANIPISTLNGLSIGMSVNPKLHTLAAVARFFNVTLSQVIGEVPFTFPNIMVPILSWNALDQQKKSIDYTVDAGTQYVSSGLVTTNPLFALYVDSKTSVLYSSEALVILEASNQCSNHDLVIASLNAATPSIKRVVKEDDKVFLASVNNNALPLQQYNPKHVHIFGIIRETRYQH